MIVHGGPPGERNWTKRLSKNPICYLGSVGFFTYQILSRTGIKLAKIYVNDDKNEGALAKPLF